jgi:hypothetical protein
MRVVLLLAWPLGLAATASCGAAPVDAASALDLRPAQAAIRTAEEIGAEQDGSAALYLGLARGEITNASRAAARGDARDAQSWAARAQVDAEVSIAIARESSVRDAARRTLDEAESLGEALKRAGEGGRGR